MKALLQRVQKASVKVEEETVGQIGSGLLVFLGITHEDTEKDIDYLVDKISNLRVFSAEDKHFEKSLLDTQGEVLVISQFTLYGGTKKGRRPDFNDAAKPEQAEELYKKFIQKLQETGLKVETGKFGAMMQVELINDGPATFLLES
ncbi:MAG TPA: D-tyrosyl-tRNA(Tyr) deacylase [Candidatus Peregrinibacteria bacterium]|nr:D-tyrosyl-tRNA(Tyr) deacylase [Candidatus Peregrinibacteria bacterium]